MKKLVAALCFGTTGVLSTNVEGYVIAGYTGNAIAIGALALMFTLFGVLLLRDYYDLSWVDDV